MAKRRRRAWLVQQGVWDMPVESMPLAVGYLKAAADADDIVAGEFDIRIFNFKGGHTPIEMAKALFFDEVPDLVGFSVCGWNFIKVGALVETLKQINPNAWAIVGGTHVMHQAMRVFGRYPDIDVVVNGEGEFTFREILRAYSAGASKHDLGAVAGISFKDESGKVTSTEGAERVTDLDEIPSPFLTGAIPLKDRDGQFRYDVALMETNRGCPYECAFCFWGGAIGQKVRRFSRERLRAELELFAKNEVVNVVLCDANFGMLPADDEFVEDLVRLKQKYGYPRHLETAWAKNKSARFYEIVKEMKRSGFRSSFTLALQTLGGDALVQMRRRNMKVNQWEGLATWLAEQGLDCYAELIWGAPGETYDSFIDGYDRLANHVSRIATYPLLLMPNTEYSEQRAKFGIVALRSDKDDFEHVLAHNSMTIDDNRRMQRFLFWARVVAENQIFRHIWHPLRRLAGVKQSEILLSLDRWFEPRTDDVSRGLKACRAEVVDSLDASKIGRGIRFFYLERRLDALLAEWWAEEMMPRVSVETSDFFSSLFDYELLTRPIYPDPRKSSQDLETVVVDGEKYFVRRNVTLRYDFPTLLESIAAGQTVSLAESPVKCDLYYKFGLDRVIDNHEFVHQFVAKTLDQLREQLRVEARAGEHVSSGPTLKGRGMKARKKFGDPRDERG